MTLWFVLLLIVAIGLGLPGIRRAMQLVRSDPVFRESEAANDEECAIAGRPRLRSIGPRLRDTVNR